MAVGYVPFVDNTGDISKIEFTTNMPNYTDYIDEYTYFSESVTFSPEGMAGLYQLTVNFINNLLPPNFIKQDMIYWQGDTPGQYYPALNDGSTYFDVLKDYWNLIFLLLFILLITILLPLCGLVFSCCRCCGNCGATAAPSDKGRDLCKKIFLGILLLACCGVLLFGVICAFASNQEMQKGTKEFPENARKVYKDSLTYLESTNDQATLLLRDNYQEFGDTFKDTIRKSGENVVEQLPLWTNASAMIKIFNFVERLPAIKTDLGTLKTSIDELRGRATDLNTGMEKITSDLTSTLNSCSFLPQCIEMSNQIPSFKINADFSKLPDITSAVDQVNGLPINQITEAAQDGKNAIDSIATNINIAINDILQQASDEVDKAGNTIAENLNTMTDVVANLTKQINNVNTTLEDGYGYLNDYYPYFYYVGLTVSCILLLVIVCLFFGLLLGVFGKRPDKNNNSCLSKKSGSFCLISAVAIIFIFTIVIGVTTFVMLIFGLAADRGICYPLRNPENSTVITVIDDYISKNNQGDIDYRIGTVLTKCFKNESLYEVFDLKKQIDLDELYTKFDINSTLDKILNAVTADLDNIIPVDYKILNDTNMKILQDLTTINPNIQFDSLQSQLDQSIFNDEFTSISESLQSIADLVKPTQPDVAKNLESNIKDMDNYNTNFLQPAITNVETTLEIARRLDTDMKMNSTSFSEAIKEFIKEVEFAQQELSKNRNLIVKAAKDFSEIVKNQVLGYMNRVIRVTKEELGQCGPLNVAFNATLIAVCDKIALPWNGFWVSLFICLATFVPIIIISVWLASIYKKYKLDEHHTGRNNEYQGKKSKKEKGYNNYYPEHSERRYDDTIPIGAVFREQDNNKGIHYNDYYQGATAPEYDHRTSRYDDMGPKKHILYGHQ